MLWISIYCMLNVSFLTFFGLLFCSQIVALLVFFYYSYLSLSQPLILTPSHTLILSFYLTLFLLLPCLRIYLSISPFQSRFFDNQFTRSPFLNDDDRDDDEVITFEGNPSSTLPRGTQRHTLSDDFVETNTNRRNKTSAEMISPNKKQH